MCEFYLYLYEGAHAQETGRISSWTLLPLWLRASNIAQFDFSTEWA